MVARGDLGVEVPFTELLSDYYREGEERRFDMNFSQGAAEWIHPDTMAKGARRVYDTIKEKTNALPEKMDQITWTRMWSALKMGKGGSHPRHPDFRGGGTGLHRHRRGWYHGRELDRRTQRRSVRRGDEPAAGTDRAA